MKIVLFPLLAFIFLQAMDADKPRSGHQPPREHGGDAVLLVVPLIKENSPPTTVTLVIRNISGHQLRYAWSGEATGVFHLYPILSKNGMEIPHNPVMRRGVLRDMIRTLQPNDEIEWEMDLRVWYADLPSGRYDLSMQSFPPNPEHDLDPLNVDSKIAVVTVHAHDEEVD